MAVAVWAGAWVPIQGGETLIEVNGASVVAEEDGWTIGSDLMKYSLGRGPGGVVTRGITDPLADRDWNRAETPDSTVIVNGRRVEVGSTATTFLDATAEEHWGGARLNLRYRIDSLALEITRSYVAYAGSPLIETWTSFRAAGSQPVTLDDISNFALTVENGRFRWILGLNGPPEQGGSFTEFEDAILDGQTYEMGSTRRSTEEFVPWFSVRVGAYQFFGSILWGGSWRMRGIGQGEHLAVTLGLPPFSTTLAPGSALEAPHAIFGITTPIVPETALALRSFLDKGVRHGRPYGSYVTYNTWFSYGTFIDEASLKEEMDLAAQMGVEQFVVDAGWWYGIDSGNPENYSDAWGGWEVDLERFPNGLGALTDHAHALGLRMGVWVEPERVALSMIDRPGLAAERFLATSDGRYDPSLPNTRAGSAQICLASPEARDWVMGKIEAFLAEVRPDYLKWDNNFWVNCNRTGHGHGAEDGNFFHTRGLNMLLDHLRVEHASLDVEICAGGGNRLSLDMLGLGDVGWMDDQTFPARRVRHNFEGLASIFPSQYLLSFVMPTAEEPVTDDPAFDLSRVLRSRMLGVLGMAWRAAEMSEGTRAAIAHHISFYKLIRPILREGMTMLLGPQQVTYPDQPWLGWEVLQHVSATTGDAVIAAFESRDAPESIVVFPKGLRSEATYSAESADFGALGTATGADLMSHGIEIRTSSLTRSHVVILRAQ